MFAPFLANGTVANACCLNRNRSGELECPSTDAGMVDVSRADSFGLAGYRGDAGGTADGPSFGCSEAVNSHLGDPKSENFSVAALRYC